MADKRITNLPFKTDPTLSDEMHINDVVSNFDKKILISVLRTLLSVPYMEVSLSNYDNDSAPAVKQGSSFDSKGVPTDIASDLTPTEYAGISNSTTFYLYWDESAGSFIYSETVPTWIDLYQGWYNGDDRALFSMYKDSGGTLYQLKTKLQDQNNIKIGNIETLNSGSSWTVPANVYRVKATIIGAGGGGGAGREGSAVTGGSTTFDGISAAGGEGGIHGNATSSNKTGKSGKAGFVSANGGMGGTALIGTGNMTTGQSGIGGQIKVEYIIVTPNSSISYSIGSGGAGGINASGGSGGVGGNGQVILEY